MKHSQPLFNLGKQQENFIKSTGIKYKRNQINTQVSKEDIRKIRFWVRKKKTEMLPTHIFFGGVSLPCIAVGGQNNQMSFVNFSYITVNFSGLRFTTNLLLQKHYDLLTKLRRFSHARGCVRLYIVFEQV